MGKGKKVKKAVKKQARNTALNTLSKGIFTPLRIAYGFSDRHRKRKAEIARKKLGNRVKKGKRI